MTEYDKQQTTSDLSSRPGSDQRGSLASPLRRRLVKGTALALPAIITLPRVEAQAMASATCAMRQGAQGSGTTGGATVVTTTDTSDYVRQEVTVYDRKTGTDQNNNPIYNDTPTYYKDSVMDVYRQYSDGTNLGADEPSDLGKVLNNPPALTYYALAFVDGTGTVVALGPGIVPSAPVSDTCFASI